MITYSAKTIEKLKAYGEKYCPNDKYLLWKLQDAGFLFMKKLFDLPNCRYPVARVVENGKFFILLSWDFNRPNWMCPPPAYKGIKFPLQEFLDILPKTVYHVPSPSGYGLEQYEDFGLATSLSEQRGKDIFIMDAKNIQLV